jgi:hypothetical protein
VMTIKEHRGTSIKLEDNHSDAGSLSIKSHYFKNVPSPSYQVPVLDNWYTTLTPLGGADGCIGPLPSTSSLRR